jgi:tetratricopeptide (TPR) repeat protein
VISIVVLRLSACINYRKQHKGFIMTQKQQLPLTPAEVYKRMQLTKELKDPGACLAAVNIESHTIQDFVPLYHSLEWELSQTHWDNEGLMPFVENNVPFIVNNSGRLSMQTALVLFAYSEQQPPDRPIQVLEMGAGTGLFARYFLDSFRDLCLQQDRDYYHRLHYYVTDYSRTTLSQWVERGLFDDHPDQTLLATCDGRSPGELLDLNNQILQLHELDAVFCNYMLDILPCTVVKYNSPRQPQELCIRTCLNKNNQALQEYTDLSYENIANMLAHPHGHAREELVPIIDVLEFETGYRDVSKEVQPYLPLIKDLGFSTGRVLLNHGALACLENCLERMRTDGFVLINDYGPVSPDEVENFGPAQRFGSTVANGLNFPLLEKYFEKLGCYLHTPSGYERAALQSRLLCKQNQPVLTQVFEEQFGLEAQIHYESALSTAREHQAAGRGKEALEAYNSALMHNRKDWHVVGEIAEFLVLQIQDFRAGVEMAQHAISLNPWYSAWLWNVLGDGLYCLEQFHQAHEAYLQAERIDAKDTRTQLNLAYTYYQNSQYDKALTSVARGLAHDSRSQYRDRLLEKQQQTLAAISGKWLSKQEQLINRTERLS